MKKDFSNCNSLENVVDVIKKECKTDKNYNDFGVFTLSSMFTFDGEYFYIEEAK